MTGREMIIFILENHLEDEEIIQDGKIAGFLTVEEVAVKFEVGVETARIWAERGIIDSVTMNGEFYIPVDAKPVTLKGAKNEETNITRNHGPVNYTHGVRIGRSYNR